MCLNAVNLMCRERLAFGGTHPPGLSGVRATEYKFPFRVRASGHRFPCPGGTSFRDTAPGDLRVTVSRNASFPGETSDLEPDERRTRQGISMNKYFFPFLLFGVRILLYTERYIFTRGNISVKPRVVPPRVALPSRAPKINDQTANHQCQ